MFPWIKILLCLTVTLATYADNNTIYLDRWRSETFNNYVLPYDILRAIKLDKKTEKLKVLEDYVIDDVIKEDVDKLSDDKIVGKFINDSTDESVEKILSIIFYNDSGAYSVVQENIISEDYQELFFEFYALDTINDKDFIEILAYNFFKFISNYFAKKTLVFSKPTYTRTNFNEIIAEYETFCLAVCRKNETYTLRIISQTYPLEYLVDAYIMKIKKVLYKACLNSIKNSKFIFLAELIGEKYDLNNLSSSPIEIKKLIKDNILINSCNMLHNRSLRNKIKKIDKKKEIKENDKKFQIQMIGNDEIDNEKIIKKLTKQTNFGLKIFSQYNALTQEPFEKRAKNEPIEEYHQLFDNYKTSTLVLITTVPLFENNEPVNKILDKVLNDPEHIKKRNNLLKTERVGFKHNTLTFNIFRVKHCLVVHSTVTWNNDVNDLLTVKDFWKKHLVSIVSIYFNTYKEELSAKVIEKIRSNDISSTLNTENIIRLFMALENHERSKFIFYGDKNN